MYSLSGTKGISGFYRFCTSTKVDYSSTLNLPQTGLQMRANAKERESQLLYKNLYKWQQIHNTGRPFVCHDGPPYANGSPHIGHALNKILKDITNRYKILSGYNVSYIPGWDCHGLPIETKVIELMKKASVQGTTGTTPTANERNNELGTSNVDTRAIEIRQVARSYALEQIELQKQAFKSWGIIGDWDNPYKTMDPEYEARQIGIFLKMFQKGLIYRALKPVFWSPSSVTALAEAELEYSETHISSSVYVLFPLLEKWRVEKFGNSFPNLSLMVWTTTPWTLPANKAISINDAYSYCIISHNGKDFSIVAESLVPNLENVLGKKFQILKKFAGSDLVGVEYCHPFRDQVSPILHGSHVTMESGTGLVHTAPGHGVDDFRVCVNNGISVFVPVDDFGNFTSEVGERLMGKHVLRDGNQEVIHILSELDVLVHHQPYQHKYPYDWRSKKPVIIRATSQWFCGLENVKELTLKSLKDVEFHPLHARDRLSSMVQTRDDWCISRQRQWGVPIPVFYHKEDNSVLITEKTIQHVQDLIQIYGTDCWWDLNVSDLLPPDLRHLGHLYVKGRDTMDVWFDSGTSWEAVINCRNIPRADLYLEGSDQHRGWFQSSLLTSVAVTGLAPYKKIITHGFVLDGEGRKMSKSLGNVVDPHTIIHGGKIGKEQFPGYGVDPLRFWVASTDYTGDVNVTPALITEMANQIRKLRNTARFLLGNLYDFVDDGSITYNDLMDIDKYMLHQLREFTNNITHYYEKGHYNKVTQLLIYFSNVDLSSFYLDVTKDRLYTSTKDSPFRRSAQFVMIQILNVLVISMAPILCHTSEDIFQHFPSKSEIKESIFQCGWFEIPKEWDNTQIDKRWKKLRELKGQFNAQYEEMKKNYPGEIRVTPDIHLIIKTRPGSEISEIFNLLGPQIAGEIFITSGVTLEETQGMSFS
eukprot:TRINITY_DN6370_c0_g1_i4.p1 TRINITY_DN6370_c0_g1~~TRINITY_DN6370_c0_g1_i4.p1  ORF type:complete len:928 (-),score=182.85 TRINITY_DN6370_c0_g1_i4:264-3047(-)